MNNKVFTKSKLIAIIAFIIIFTVGFRHNQDVDDFSYPVALGIDAGENDNLIVTFQFSKSSSSGDSGGSSEPAPTFVYTIESSSITSAIKQINNYVSKEMNLSHCKFVIISEELAQKGITNEVASLINDVELRPDTGIVISKCNSRYFIENAQPDFESLVSKYYEIVTMTSEVTGYTSHVKISEFYNALYADEVEPCAILRGNKNN